MPSAGALGEPTRDISTAVGEQPPVVQGLADSGAQATAETAFERSMAEAWRSAGVEIAPLADDGEFYRRVALDLTGSVPSAEQAARFIDDASADKREVLVDELLASEDYARYWAEVYADLLLGQPTPQTKKTRAGMIAWLAESFAQGRSYDAMVSDLLTASGEFPGGQEASYLLVRGRQKQVEALAGATARIFLGVQIECAQCHDHPYYDQYKQQDFYRFAAYFSRTKIRRGKKNKSKNKNKNKMNKSAPVLVTIKDRRRGELRIPLADGSPGEVASPRFLGRDVQALDGESRRQTLARAIRESDLLAKTVVNRTWATMLGRGLLDPWDDLVAEHDPRHPETLNILAQDFVKSGYDHRALLRQISLSQAYQRSAVGADDSGKAARVFARAAVRPLDAYQLFSSLAVATGLVESEKPAYRRRVEERRERALGEYLFVFADDEMGEADVFAGNVPQALLLLNGDLSNAGVRVRAGGTVQKATAAAKQGGAAAAVETLYLAAYGRRPGAEELQATFALLEAHRGPGGPGAGKAGKTGKYTNKAYEDLFYALLLSSEFVTNH
ncbi:MAG TPA: DUF1549 domain-containing protein [Nannocystis exedens]|nr:DUF1549 domain-containing protein [Nannocystis exedens]